MNIVKQLRLKAGLQQQELASMIPVSKPTVSDWEHQRKNPRGENLKRLAEIFQVDELVILGVVPPPIDTGQEAVPRTVEARILASGIDQMPQEERERALDAMRIIFAQYASFFERKDTDDTDDA